MQKTIKVLSDKMAKLQETNKGILQGGFTSIKGGFNAALDSTNTNPSGCTNTGNCTQSSNSYDCHNTGTCFM